MDKSADEILEFWFKKSKSNQWFDKNIEYDNIIKKKFLEQHKLAINGKYGLWKNSALESLAFIILVDQFSRNMYREDPKSYEFDHISLEYCKNGLNKSYEKKLENNDQKLFFILPLIHCENIQEQNLAIEILNNDLKNDPKFNEINRFFVRHKEIIQMFGRFPHRNKILNRKSTEDEIKFLKTPFSSF